MASQGATIRDVAERAGVSTATVSRVVRGIGSVTPETRQRVHQVVARDDPHERPLLVDHREGVDPAVDHLAGGLAEGVVRAPERGHDLGPLDVPGAHPHRRHPDGEGTRCLGVTGGGGHIRQIGTRREGAARPSFE